jgi:hypothetical protein
MVAQAIIEGVFDSLPGDRFLSLDGLGIDLEKDLDTVSGPCGDLRGLTARPQHPQRVMGRRARHQQPDDPAPALFLAPGTELSRPHCRRQPGDEAWPPTTACGVSRIMALPGILDALVTLRNTTDTVVRHLGPDRTPLVTRRTAMLPLPPIRTSPSAFRRLIRWIDAYTLWAFNPQPPVGR